jgi:DNA-binding response OmpR family regulator
LLDQPIAVANVLIVDDNPANLRVLEDMLRHENYEVSSFPAGKLALADAVANPPDLILLDINMPEMNGYEVCSRLKAAEETSEIPVIFLSALGETEDKVKAFRVGAVDFISKPFQFEEVLVRVKTHLKLHALQLALQQNIDNLESTVAERTRNLAQSTAELAVANDRLTLLDRSKSDFLNLISHEFRTPLVGLLGVSEIILEEMSPTSEHEELRAVFARSRQRMLSILDDALLLTHLDVYREKVGSTSVSLRSALDGAIEDAREFAESRRVTLAPSPRDLGFVCGTEEELLVRTFKTLFETAIKFSAEGETVKLDYEASDDSQKIIITARGRRIPIAALPRFFQIFSIGEAITPGGDLGLGPPVAARVLSLFGGSITVDNLEPSGIQFRVTLKNGQRMSSVQ